MDLVLMFDVVFFLVFHMACAFMCNTVVILPVFCTVNMILEIKLCKLAHAQPQYVIICFCM